MAHSDLDLGSGIGWCHFIMCLPSLRNFVGHWVAGVDDGLIEDEMNQEYFDDQDDNCSGYPLNFRHRIRKPATVYPRSNVKELFFAMSQLDVEALEDITKCTLNLERFSYESSGPLVPGGCDWTCPKLLIRTLAKNAGHSLKELVVEWGPIPSERYVHLQCFNSQLRKVLIVPCAESRRRHYVVSLRSFQTLTTLKCYREMLFSDWWKEYTPVYKLGTYDFVEERERACQNFDLRSILPASLEALHLQHEPNPYFKEPYYPDDTSFDILFQPSSSTPDLKQIYIEWWSDEKRRKFRTESMDTMTPLPSMKENPLFGLCEGYEYHDV